MRYVAIDLGDKRTGVACGDAQTRLVTPMTVVEVGIEVAEGRALVEALARVIEDQLGPARAGDVAAARLHTPGELVVGLPLNMDGSEGPRARRTRAFAQRIAHRVGRPVHFQDERLSSARAEWELSGSGLTHQRKRERRDALAAAAILEDFLAGVPGADRSPDPPPATSV